MEDLIVLSNKSPNGTSFYHVTLFTSIKELKNVIGNPQYYDNTGDDKSNAMWVCETSDGILFTIYDWKEYRVLDENEDITFHIGGRSFLETCDVRERMLKLFEDDKKFEPDTLKAINELRDVYLTED